MLFEGQVFLEWAKTTQELLSKLEEAIGDVRFKKNIHEFDEHEAYSICILDFEVSVLVPPSEVDLAINPFWQVIVTNLFSFYEKGRSEEPLANITDNLLRVFRAHGLVCRKTHPE